MKYFMVTFSVISILYTEVNSIVPKEIKNPNLEIYFKGRSLDDTNIPKPRILLQPDIVSESVIKTSLKEQTKFPIDVPIDDEQRSNRLAEVNLKEVIDSSELIDNKSVEDFIDYSDEEAGAKELKPFKNKDPFILNFHKTSISKGGTKRIKRAATIAYDGRYKTEDIQDVKKTIAMSRPQGRNGNILDEHKNTMKPNNGLIKSRLKRSSNIIEEENFVTTVSVFKFTGRQKLLNQDLAFKNIHT